MIALIQIFINCRRQLQLIVNEITVKINKNRLPSISLKYEEDLRKANLIINEINCLLEATPVSYTHLTLPTILRV